MISKPPSNRPEQDWIKQLKQILQQNQLVGKDNSNVESRLAELLDFPEHLNSRISVFVLDLTQMTYIATYGDGLSTIGFHTDFIKILGPQAAMGIVHPEDRVTYQRLLERYFRSLPRLSAEERNNTRMTTAMRLVQANGDTRWVEQEMICLTEGETGKLTHMVALLQPLPPAHGLQHIRWVISVYGDSGKVVRRESGGRLDQMTPDLTAREMQVLHLLTQGFSTQAISEKLAISPHTVRVHRKNLLRKFGCSNTAELVYQALTNGVVISDNEQD